MGPWSRQPALQEPCLATESAAMPSRERAWCAEKANQREWSSAVPFVFVEQAAKLFNFFARGAFASEGVHHQVTGRPLKHPLQHVARKLPLGLRGRDARLIDVRTLGFVSPDNAFCSHYLQEFQDRGVSQGFGFFHRVVYLADGRRSAGP